MSNGATPNGPSAPTHTESQRYLSTRGDDSGVGPFLPFSLPFVLARHVAPCIAGEDVVADGLNYTPALL
jgi:hypothetical protein